MGSNKGLICSALASQKLKTSSFWGSEKAMNREPWPRQVGLICCQLNRSQLQEELALIAEEMRPAGVTSTFGSEC